MLLASDTSHSSGREAGKKAPSLPLLRAHTGGMEGVFSPLVFQFILPHTDMSPTMWHRAHVSSSEPLHRKLVCVLVAQSCLTLCNSWTVVHQAPLCMEFFRQEYWVGCHALLQDRKQDKINTLTSLLCTPPLKLVPGSDRWGQAAVFSPARFLSFSVLYLFLP